LYPAPVELSNLAAIKTLKHAFDCVVGYSDHTLGIHIPLASVALGASIIEKHFTLRRADGGPDAGFSLEPKELKQLVISIRETEQAIGKPTYKVSKQEAENKVQRSCYD